MKETVVGVQAKQKKLILDSNQKCEVFLSSQGLTLYLCFLIGPFKESLSLLYRAFLRPLLTLHPDFFPFLSVTNFTKLERLHRAASRAIYSCLSSSPISLLLPKAFLSSLRVTLTHFALSSYERALCFSTSFPISSLARLEGKPRLCKTSWRAFASIHSLILPTSPREALFGCPFPPYNLPFFTVESTLYSSCSRSDPFSLAKVRLSPTSRSGSLDRLLCSFSVLQRRLWRTCQLLSLWH